MKTLNNNLIEVTRLLSHGQFYDGNSIGEQLNISRTAVWKIIKKLGAYGVPITATKGKGYSLLDQFILLDQKKITSQINSEIIIDVFESISSTIDYLQPFVSERKPRICITEMQTNGVGRFQRQWHSPFGKNIYLSLLFPFDNDISELIGLSLVIALAINNAITNCYQLKHATKIKWPNDIFYDDKKLAGSLIQIHAETNGFCNAIISAGINVNMTDDDDNMIKQNWTSVRNENQQYNDRNDLCIELINNLLQYIEQFKQHGLAIFTEQWLANDYLLNKQIKVRSGNDVVEGIAQGINSQGHLLLQLGDGSQPSFSSGDTTIVK